MRSFKILTSTQQIKTNMLKQSKQLKSDRLKGAFFGFVLGDSAGAPIEHLNRKSLERLGINEETFDYPLKKEMQPNHRYDVKPTFTDDTIALMFTINCIATDKNKKVNQIEIAKAMTNWYKNGIPEIGDYSNAAGGTTGRLCTNPEFVTNPQKVAEEIKSASNGCLMRSIATCFFSETYSVMIKQTEILCKVTHTDLRCIVCCFVINTLVWNCIYNDDIPYDQFVNLLNNQSHKDDFEKFVHYKDLSECFLDGVDESGYYFGQIGYCFRMTAAAVFAYRNRFLDYKSVLKKIFCQAGDTDTNGAICGAIIGATQGYDKLPQDWLQHIQHLDYAENQYSKFRQGLD